MSDHNIRQIEKSDFVIWTKLFNSKSTLVPFRGKIPFHGLQKLCEGGFLSTDTMFLAEDDDSPYAVARLFSMGRGHPVFLTDINVKRTKNEHYFIECILDYARSLQASRVVSWVSGASPLLSDLLGDFTFEPMTVHLIMENVMLFKPESSVGDHQLFSLEKSNTEFTLPSHLSRTNAMSLNELNEHVEKSWYPFGVSVEPPFRTFASRNQTHQGWLDLSSSQTLFTDTLSDAIQNGLLQMYNSGIRDVQTEVVAGTGYKQGLQNLGFGIKTTLFELCLNLVY